MSKCVLYTYVYNSEDMIGRTIESVLSLTYTNWEWFLVDSGSTDSTGAIIKKYAEKDSRIIPLRNKENLVWEKGNRLTDVIVGYKDDDFLFRLDGDDEYKPDFLEKMLRFISDNNLDVAVCGHDFIDARSGELRGVRKLENNLILDSPEKYNAYFPKYHQFMRTYWCKLIKMAVMRRYDDGYVEDKTELGVSFGVDTLFMTEVFRKADRIGILAESLLKYYMYPQSFSYRWDDKRITSDRVLDDDIRSFLIDKCGVITQKNNDFLNTVYFNAIRDTIALLVHSPLAAIDRINGLHNIFMSEKTKQLSDYPFVNNDQHKYFATVGKWIEAYTENLATEEQNNPVLIELTIAVKVAAKESDSEIYAYLLEAKKMFPESAAMIDIDKHMLEITSKYPIFRDVTARLIGSLSEVVKYILRNEFFEALDAYISTSDNVEIDSEDEEAYLILGQNLAAAAEDSAAYIYFMKVWVSFLLDTSRLEEAGKVLDEYLQLLPNDDDFIELQSKLASASAKQDDGHI